MYRGLESLEGLILIIVTQLETVFLLYFQVPVIESESFLFWTL